METFIRKELKYQMDDAAKHAFLQEAADDLQPDVYFDCQIYSIYLDTEQFDLMRLCENKPDFKCKARLRAYKPVLSGKDQVFFELKKKVEGTSCKRRKEFTGASLRAFLEQPEITDVVSGEIAALLESRTLRPRFSLYAHRFCYVWKDDPSIRITIDDTLTWRNVRHGLFRDPADQPLLSHGENILEIKCSGNLPLRLCRLLERPGIRSGSFSKAGAVYARLLERTML